MAEGEAEEDDAADGDPVLSEVNSGIVPSAEEVVSGTVGSVRAGSPEGRESGASSNLSAVTNAHPATAETNALASAHAQVSP
jgi:broad specificity polyphosphatase/5'/3'-nucleotidase SurE